MQVEIRQPTQQHIQTINQAVLTMQQMSENRKKQVFDLIELICVCDGISVVDDSKTSKQKPKKRHAGTAKGKVIFADDFDEPLEDFKDYM